jgi:hypothetical protein
MKNYLLLVAVVSALVFAPSSANAQTTASQNFTVSVPTSISISAPAATGLTHDQSDNPQAFPSQNWVVRGNAMNGLNVSFTSLPFSHSTISTIKQDARLKLSIGTKAGPGNWTLGVDESSTNYVSSTPATVTASSDGVGRANLGLVVTFLSGEFGTFAAGDYVTTVVGTVAAK